MKTAIEIHGVDEVTLSLTAHAELAKKEALKASSLIKVVNSDITLQAAADALVSIKRVLKTVESSRKDVKAPVLEMGKRIDALAVEFAEELEINESRICFLIAPYEEEIRKAAAELEASRQEEIKYLKEGSKEWESLIREKPIEATKIEGIIGKEVIKFEVVDIMALSRSHPHLIRMEVNTTAMNAYLASGQPVPTSVNVWKEFKVNARP